MKNAADVGVCAITVPAVRPDDWRALSSLPDNIYGVSLYYSFGVHPYTIDEIDPAEDDSLLASLEKALEASSRVVAVGETGLHEPRQGPHSALQRQVRYLRCQLDLSRRSGLPAIVHCVRAHDLLLELFDEAPTPPSIVHAFTGSAELAAQYVARGHYLGIGGAVTFPNNPRVRRELRSIDPTRILLETDAPDASPFPARPQPNEPRHLPVIAQAVARACATELGELAERTTANARAVYRVGAT